MIRGRFEPLRPDLCQVNSVHPEHQPGPCLCAEVSRIITRMNTNKEFRTMRGGIWGTEEDCAMMEIVNCSGMFRSE